MASLVPVRAFYCFDSTDRALCESLDRHLAPLKHEGRLQTWGEGHIVAGQEWEREYDQQFSTARLLILLVSSEFLASERGQRYLQMALDRQRAREATVVPILVRPCAWGQTELNLVQMIPRDHRALTQQANRDAAWTEIVQEISRVLASLHHQVYLIVAPEDREQAARLSEKLAPIGITTWYLKDEQLSAERHAEREAMRQASLVLLVASSTAFSSRIVRVQKELAETYQRPIEVVWMSEGDGEWETAGIWRGGAHAGSDGTEKAPLLTHLKEQLETGMPTEQPPLQQIAEPRNPYKGLRSFTAEDTGDFFGRDVLIDTLTSAVKDLLAQEHEGPSPGRLLAVLGASGSGKSSVVLAGLLPRLKGGGIPGSDAWLYLDSITPGPHPLEALALTLSQQPALGNAASLHHELCGDSLRALYLLTCQLIHSPSHNVVLFIDQFEELFSSQVSEEDRQHFLDLLITAVTEPEGPLLVVVTMRSDFLDRAMLYPDLYGLLDAHHVTVLPMERDELRQVIEAPARLPDVQITFEGDLVGDLLFELRGQVGALPLLEFTLDQLFVARSGQMFTLSAYQEIGGVKGALANHAQATYESLPTKEHQELARSLFLRLINPGHSEQDTTRRRARLSEFELPDVAQTRLLRETMDTFLKKRLLIASEQAGIATVEVSHEALIREWALLIAWLHEARQDTLLQQKISEAAEEWQHRHHPNDRLYRGAQLKEAQAWAKRNPLSQNEAAFLRAATRRRRHLLLNMIALALALMITVGGTLRFYVQLQQAQAQIHDPTQVTTLANDGIGSLRWAIENAPAGKTITFASNLAGQTITLTNTLLIIKKHLSLQGPQRKVTITIRSALYGINVDVGAVVAITNMIITGSNKANSVSLFTNQGILSLTNSTVSGNTVSSDLSAGGGIYNASGTVNLINSTVSGNTDSGNLYGGDGGGIYNNYGKVNLMNSTVSGNTSSSQGYGYGRGGGIYNYHGAVNLMNSTVSGNTASSQGGGIVNEQGTVNLMNSTVSGNTASSYYSYGGGISNDGNVNLMDSTVSGNTASSKSNYDSDGGGIYNQGKVNLMNSTVSGNTTSSQGGYSSGGGIINEQGTMSLMNSTVSDNTASSKSSYDSYGGGISNDYGKVNLMNSTVSGNTASNDGGGLFTADTSDATSTVRNSLVVGNHASQGPDVAGTLTSLGYNLIQNTKGSVILDPYPKHGTDHINIPGSQIKIDPNLQLNGSTTTETHALLPGSLAIDAIPSAACLITTDQRGIKRPQGFACDIGAYEYTS